MTTYLYAIRIQNIPGYEEIVYDLFTANRFKRCIRIHHTGKKGNNPHWHLLVECDYKQTTLREHLKKFLTLGKGNKHLSIKPWDGKLKAVAYLFHEGTKPDMIWNFTPKEIEEAEELNKETQEKIKSNAPAAIVQEISMYFIEKKIFSPTVKEIFDQVFDRLQESGNWLPNKFQFERWMMRIQANVRDRDEWRTYKQQLFDSWYGTFNY